MELTLEHIAPYLPYGLQIQGQTHLEIQELSGIREGTVYTTEGNKQYGWASLFEIKPIFRTLADLTKEELVEWFGLNDTLIIKEIHDFNYQCVWNLKFKHKDPRMNLEDGYHHVEFGISLNQKFKVAKLQWLFSKHIDVFRLINEGLAIEKPNK